MADTHAQRQQGEEKVHGDPMEDAVETQTHQQRGGQQNEAERNRAIPEAENGSHSRSQAAHLGGHQHDHTKPVGDLRQYEQERELPQEISRAGKEYRRQ